MLRTILMSMLGAALALAAAAPGQAREDEVPAPKTPATPPEPAAPPAPEGPPKVTLRLHDGSVLVGTLAIDALKIETEYGVLSLPLRQIYRVEFGALPRQPELEAIAKLIQTLGDADFKVRENAHRTLLELGPKALEPLKAAAESAKDPEVKRRIQALEKGIAGSDPDAQVLDLVVARKMRARGKLVIGPLETQTRFGKLIVQPQDLATMEFDTLRVAMRETFDRKPRGWEFTAQGATVWHVTRKGGGNGPSLRCAVPDQAQYGNEAVAAASTSEIDLRGLNTPVLRYRYRALFEEGSDAFGVQISADGGENWTFVTQHGYTPDWVEQNLPLDAYKGGSIKIRFFFHSDESDTEEGVYIDDLVVSETPED